jgi:phosphopantothenoylcysteine decarboxylase/phosphopantothenate--cysteine ligase
MDTVSQENSFDIVITAGGTRELIDDVRYIGNFSSGTLGYELAKAYSQAGYKVALLAPKFVTDQFGTLPSVTHIRFDSTADLDMELHRIAKAKLVLHLAAVSDYTPSRTSGKISSDQDELIIRLKVTPKIIAGLREHFGQETKIVGFKLLSGAPTKILIAKAQEQILKNNTDLCVANDLQEIRSSRIVHIVQANGQYTSLSGTAGEVATQLCENIQIEGPNTVCFSVDGQTLGELISR